MLIREKKEKVLKERKKRRGVKRKGAARALGSTASANHTHSHTHTHTPHPHTPYTPLSHLTLIRTCAHGVDLIRGTYMYICCVRRVCTIPIPHAEARGAGEAETDLI